ncbi:MAG: hypothetical protein U1F11_02820 [Steroidobacteraceae bacterium]
MREVALEWLTGRGAWLPLAAFAFTGAIVFLIASRLARHADAIADATGLGRVWIGSLLLAAATSLPELTTDVSAARLGARDIGVGDLLGSTLANMLILALLDMVFARRRILAAVAIDHALVGGLAIVMTAIVGLSVAAGGLGSLGPVGIESALLLGVYLFGMHAVFKAAQPTATAPAQQLELGESSATLLREGVLGLALATLGLAACAPVLVLSAEALALETGSSDSFVGTMLVGFTTSFPEIAASVAAIRMGAVDLAVGNVFGSNAFNMCIVAAMDLADGEGPVLAAVSRQHVMSAFAAICCVGLGTMAILARSQRRTAIVRIESLAIVATYLTLAWILSRG